MLSESVLCLASRKRREHAGRAVMTAKKTSKNRLTLPKKVVESFRRVEYFVRVEEGRITLVSVRADRLERLHARMKELGLSKRDVRDAVAWARSPMK